MNNLTMKSQNFVGESENVLSNINLFLCDIKAQHRTKTEFHLVHALVFSKQMSEEEVTHINLKLGELYKTCGFDVLGGDTSSGAELSIFISTIVI